MPEWWRPALVFCEPTQLPLVPTGSSFRAFTGAAPTVAPSGGRRLERPFAELEPLFLLAPLPVLAC